MNARIHPNILTEAEIAERRKRLSLEQIEDAILLSPLSGYDLADLASAIKAKAKEIDPDWRFDVEPLRDALGALEDRHV